MDKEKKKSVESSKSNKFIATGFSLRITKVND